MVVFHGPTQREERAQRKTSMFDVTLGRARTPMAVTQWGRQYSPVIVRCFSLLSGDTCQCREGLNRDIGTGCDKLRKNIERMCIAERDSEKVAGVEQCRWSTLVLHAPY